MKHHLIARDNECKVLDQCMTSDQSEFVIVGGRRRIGKTYLVDRYFNGQFDFKYVGGHNLRMRDQLRYFAQALTEYSHTKHTTFSDWHEAFDALREYLKTLPRDHKRIIFIDEMPWMDSKRSNFVSALEYFWNAWAASEYDIVLVATGSATSWMTDKILRNRGGLHNRVTRRIYLKPFTLGETEEYLRSKNASWDRYEILQGYMFTGGVPFYLNKLNVTDSVSQNIDRLCFAPTADLRNEFEELFHAVFPIADSYIHIARVLSQHHEGLTRKQIEQMTKINGSNLTRILSNLEICDFIGKRVQYGNKKTEMIYRLIDFYTLFYFRFIEQNVVLDTAWWQNHLNDSSVSAWQGLTFEVICMEHHQQIKKALGISGMATEVTTWRTKPDKKKNLSGAQIDMIIERADRLVHLCEMKFSQEQYIITKDYDMRLRERMSVFKFVTKTKKAPVYTFITTYGVKNMQSHSIIHSQVTMDDLFAP